MLRDSTFNANINRLSLSVNLSLFRPVNLACQVCFIYKGLKLGGGCKLLAAYYFRYVMFNYTCPDSAATDHETVVGII